MQQQQRLRRTECSSMLSKAACLSPVHSPLGAAVRCCCFAARKRAAILARACARTIDPHCYQHFTSHWLAACELLSIRLTTWWPIARDSRLPGDLLSILPDDKKHCPCVVHSHMMWPRVQSIAPHWRCTNTDLRAAALLTLGRRKAAFWTLGTASAGAARLASWSTTQHEGWPALPC